MVEYIYELIMQVCHRFFQWKVTLPIAFFRQWHSIDFFHVLSISYSSTPFDVNHTLILTYKVLAQQNHIYI